MTTGSVIVDSQASGRASHGQADVAKRRRWHARFVQVATVVGVLVMWEGTVRLFHIQPIFLPSITFILLADEVVVMTARPGCVKATIPIDLARPRSLKDVNSSEFGILFDEIYHLIKEEVDKTIGMEMAVP